MEGDEGWVSAIKALQPCPSNRFTANREAILKGEVPLPPLDAARDHPPSPQSSPRRDCIAMSLRRSDATEAISEVLEIVRLPHSLRSLL